VEWEAILNKRAPAPWQPGPSVDGEDAPYSSFDPDADSSDGGDVLVSRVAQPYTGDYSWTGFSEE
jgi:hypothetical protein